jgi:REP element-mobilizing transposase RayT
MAKPHRLEKFDYRTPGAYFITICAKDRAMVFEDRKVQDVVVACWKAIPEHMPNAGIDSFVVMPNHVYGIITITEDSGPRRHRCSPLFRPSKVR